MIDFKPFRALRPCYDIASEVASKPYDVLNSVRLELKHQEMSLFSMS